MMPLSNIPPAVNAFIKAMEAGDLEALAAQLASDATLRFDGRTISGSKIGEWFEERIFGASLHPLNVARRAGETVLTVMARGAPRLLDVPAPVHVDLTFEMRGEVITSLAVALTKTIPVPLAVSEFVFAMNTFNLESFVALFRNDSLVNDQLREIWGKSAIAVWAKEEVVGDRMTMHVTEVIEHLGHILVRANLDGDFDKRGLPDPVRVTFSFFLVDDRIGQLIILSSRDDD